jgi:putative copper resistance protein D
MPADTWTLLGAWQFAPTAGIPLAVLAGAYLAGVRRAATRRPGKAWPVGRTAAFLGGLAAAALATQGPAAVYDDVSLPAHMVQHLLLIMVAPPLLVCGRPVTLALHVTRNPWHTRIKRVLRSRAVAAATWPGTGIAVYSAVVAGTHLTGLLTARGALHDAEHGAYLVAGYLFFLPVAGSEPIRWRASALGRYLLLLAAMPVDIATGAVLMLRGGAGGYSAADVHAGGLVMVAGGEAIMAALALVFAVAVVRTAATDAAADIAVPDSRQRPDPAR